METERSSRLSWKLFKCFLSNIFRLNKINVTCHSNENLINQLHHLFYLFAIISNYFSSLVFSRFNIFHFNINFPSTFFHYSSPKIILHFLPFNLPIKKYPRDAAKNFFPERQREKNWERFFLFTNNEAYPPKNIFCILRDQQSLLNSKKQFTKHSLKNRFSVADKQQNNFCTNICPRFVVSPLEQRVWIKKREKKNPCVFLTNTKTRIKNSFENINAL